MKTEYIELLHEIFDFLGDYVYAEPDKAERALLLLMSLDDMMHEVEGDNCPFKNVNVDTPTGYGFGV